LLKLYLLILLVVLVFPIAKGGFSISPIEEDVAAYRWNLGWWEATHFWNKWIYKGKIALTSNKSNTEHENILVSFFNTSRKIHDLEENAGNRRGIQRTISTTSSDVMSAGETASLHESQSKLKPVVEEYIENIVGSTLSRHGLESRLGILWPPVDVDFSDAPYVLIVSPRDKIERQMTLTLSPSLSSANIDELERVLIARHNVSAFITSIAGIATYPSIVPPSQELRGSLQSLIHEWLHQYWFFHPLGRNYWRDSNMTTLNETAANLAGYEIGEQVFQALLTNTEVIVEEDQSEFVYKKEFDFKSEMKRTRLSVEQMLSDGMVDEAETYMQDRRLVFENEGFYIRKLNQAYFAFYGSYGDNPASISPINDEVDKYRQSFRSIGEFIRHVAKFSTYEEFQQEAGFEH